MTPLITNLLGTKPIACMNKDAWGYQYNPLYQRTQ